MGNITLVKYYIIELDFNFALCLALTRQQHVVVLQAWSKDKHIMWV